MNARRFTRATPLQYVRRRSHRSHAITASWSCASDLTAASLTPIFRLMLDSSAADPKERFTSRVDAYVAARPRYPRAMIERLQHSIGLTPAWQIVDVGSGTGISCELFLQNGNPVT